jgi:hypothetical protein
MQRVHHDDLAMVALHERARAVGGGIQRIEGTEPYAGSAQLVEYRGRSGTGSHGVIQHIDRHASNGALDQQVRELLLAVERFIEDVHLDIDVAGCGSHCAEGCGIRARAVDQQLDAIAGDQRLVAHSLHRGEVPLEQVIVAEARQSLGEALPCLAVQLAPGADNRQR